MKQKKGRSSASGSAAGAIGRICWRAATFLRKCVFYVVSVGPIPTHIAFIMDGNRRYAKRRNLPARAGHEAGFVALMYMLVYCCELGVKYVTAYAFSIDNFKLEAEEVESIMDLMKEKIELLTREDSIVHRYKAKLVFVGELTLLPQPVWDAAQKLMECTSNYTNILLTICVAYTSTNEMVHAAREASKAKRVLLNSAAGTHHQQLNYINDDLGIATTSRITTSDLDKHMLIGGGAGKGKDSSAAESEIIVRTSGENRLSNFMLWQSGRSYLCASGVLWPEFGFWHLLWAILGFQHYHSYFEKLNKQL